MKSIVTLTTTAMTKAVTIHQFQFGTIAAKKNTYCLSHKSVSARTEGQEIFWFDGDVDVPAAQAIRYNLRFELNEHNSANLQIRLTSPSGIEWRWS